jgi:hypothetical protein
MKDQILFSVVTAPLVFGAFYALPFMVQHLAQTKHIRLIGFELVLVVGPIIGIFALFQHEWRMAIFFLSASVGCHWGFFKSVRRSAEKSNRGLNQPKKN